MNEIASGDLCRSDGVGALRIDRRRRGTYISIRRPS